jgi:hypothetical protein
LSRDKVRDVVGLYLDPPERAVVLCVDEKSQIQALDRTAPILPMLPGTPQRATHDYKRSGTSSLYAALDITTGKVIGSLHARHRAIEFKKFLQILDRSVQALNSDIRAWIDIWNDEPKPFVWTKDRRPNPRLHHPPLRTNQRLTTLGTRRSGCTLTRVDQSPSVRTARSRSRR